MSTVRLLEIEQVGDFIRTILDEYALMQWGFEYAADSRGMRHHRPLPVVVGAGISATAGIPLNVELLKSLGDEMSVSEPTYLVPRPDYIFG